ncbi:hypothetical protein HYG89_15770 [Acinetobacter sp. SwsAc5]|uniref:hypothetical protein n=1 Tax=Acinetobacter sp. SwsAc5 TaxID=2749438 RepID=UPI0015C11910|nr:hypothetical protein [Acinetobacter sp. SwsAc5]NWK53955.1 hypothetical protein [Acinetobacter sp. SwsAc5]
MKITYLGDPLDANKRLIIRIEHKGVLVELKLFPHEADTKKVMSIVNFLKDF